MFKFFKRKKELKIWLLQDIRNNQEIITISDTLGISNRLTYGYERIIKELTDKEAYNYWLNNDNVILE